MRWPGENVNFDSPTVCPYQVLNDYWILVALVLHPERMPGFVDELSDAFAAVPRTPDEVRFIPGLKRFPRPIRIEALHDFANFMFMGGDDGIVTCFGDVSCLPIQGLNEGG